MPLVVVLALVPHGDQVEAPRRRRRARLRSRPAFEEARELTGRTLEHRSDQSSDHVAQERIGGDLELEGVSATVPRCGLDRPTEDPVLRLGRGESAEVVLAEEELGRLPELVLVKWIRIPPGSARLER